MRTAALLVAFFVSGSASAASLTPGNMLITDPDSRTIYEYSPRGWKIQEFRVPEPGGHGSDDHIRDLVLDDRGDLHVFDGTYAVGLSTLRESEWRYSLLPEVNSSIGESAGKITSYSRFLYVVDEIRFGTEPLGVVRIDTTTGKSTRFGEPAYPADNGTDLCARANGELYVLVGWQGDSIDVYDSVRLNHLRRIDLTPIKRSIYSGRFVGLEVAADGTIFLLGNQVYKLTPTGEFVERKPFSWQIGVQDFDLSDDGLLMITQFDGSVSVLDASTLTEASYFQTTGYYSTRSFGATIPHPPANDFRLVASKVSVAGENTCRFTLSRLGPSNLSFPVQVEDTSSFLETPAQVIIPVGKSEASFVAKAHAVNADISVLVRARNGIVNRSTTLLLKALAPSAIAFSPQPVQGGNSTNCRVALNGVAGENGRILGVSDDSAYCKTPDRVVVPPGSASTTFPIVTLPVMTPTVASIRIRVSAGEKTAILRIAP